MSTATPETCHCSALRRATRRLTRLYDEALAPIGLGVNQYAVLAGLDRLAPLPVPELAAVLVADRTTLTRLLKPLEARGLVANAAAAGDRRRRIVSLTPEGAAAVAAGRPLWAAAQRRYEAAMGPGEAARLRRALDRVVALDLGASPVPAA